MKEVLAKMEQAKKIIHETLSRAEHPFVEFTGGKDSLVTLHLVRQVSKEPVSVLFIDTSVHFDEVYHFVEKMRKLWNLRLVIEKAPGTINRTQAGKDKEACCRQLKRDVLRDSAKKHGIDYLLTGSNRDDAGDQEQKDFFSQREEYIEVRPLIGLCEVDLWKYLRHRNLPYCTLYDRGYKHLDCIPCTDGAGVEENAPADEDMEEVARRLKQLGYL